MSAQEKIKAIQDEMDRTQKNKATNRHLGVLKARIAKIKQQERDRITRSQGQRGDGYTVRKDGDSTVVLLGLPSVGKSTLLNSLTKSRVHVENRLFATLDPSSRRLRFPREREFIITDTVGFIRKLLWLPI